MSHLAALERLGKWRSFFAGWQLGTRSLEDPESNAVRDHREATIILRAEVTALAGLLVEKGIFTAAEFTDAIEVEAIRLELDYQRRFPGFAATADGLALDVQQSAETMRRMHFRP